VDLTVDLTFFEEWSSRERRKMDADTNGRIARVEVERYLQKLAPELAKQVRLLVAGHEVPLVSLYEPEVDLLGSDKAGPATGRALTPRRCMSCARGCASGNTTAWGN